MSSIIFLSIYFLSFFPLWITIVIVDLKSLIEGGGNKYTEIVGIILIAAGLIISLFFVFVKFCSTRDEKYTYEIDTAKENKMVTAQFLLSYILPLAAFDFTLWVEALEFLIFFLAFGFLCIRHNFFCVNIVLEFRHYRVYECRLINDDGVSTERTVISRKTLNMNKGQNICVKVINNEFLLDMDK